MIRNIYFIDECITGKSKYSDVETIDCSEGYKLSMKRFNRLLYSRDYFDILTNQTALLKCEYCWDSQKHRPRIYLPLHDSEGNRTEWKNIEEFTIKILRNSSDIEKMYRNGDFDRYIGKKKKLRYGK